MFGINNYLAKFPAVEDKLKLVTPVIGLVTLGLAAASIKPRGSDIFFIITIITGFLFSLGLLVAKYFDWIKENETKLWRWVDVIIHGFLSALLIVGWVICMVNIFTLWSIISSGFMAVRFFAMIFVSMEIGFYGLIAWIKFKKLRGGPEPHDTVT